MRRFLLAAVMFGDGVGRAGGRHARSSDPARQLHRRACTRRVNWQGFYVGGQGAYRHLRHEFHRRNAERCRKLLGQHRDRAVWRRSPMAAARQGVGSRHRLRRLRRLQQPMGRRRLRPRSSTICTASSAESQTDSMSARSSTPAAAITDVTVTYRPAPSLKISDIGDVPRLAPATRSDRSCPICSAAWRSGRPTSIRTARICGDQVNADAPVRLPRRPVRSRRDRRQEQPSDLRLFRRSRRRHRC